MSFSEDAYAFPSVKRAQKPRELTGSELAERRKHLAFRQETFDAFGQEGGPGYTPGVDASDICVFENGHHTRQGMHCPHSSTRAEMEIIERVTL